MKKILIVEDEPKVAGFISRGLEEQLYQTDVAYDGQIGRKKALAKNFDLIILDINIPHINGFELCKEIRSRNFKIPILMLTAMGTTDDKLTGFDSGADDYLVKPFEFRELLARIKALLKRAKGTELVSNFMKVADLEMNLDRKTVKRAGKKIDLTPKEFALLEYFMTHKGKVLSRADIAEKIWKINFDTGTNIIDVYVNFLRKKIDKDFSQKLIHTHVGMGYILEDE